MTWLVELTFTFLQLQKKNHCTVMLHFGHMDENILLSLKFQISPYIGISSRFTSLVSLKHLHIPSLCAIFVKFDSCWHLLLCGVFIIGENVMAVSV